MPEPPSADDDHPGEASQEELEAARQQLSAYRELIEEVPEIYEQRFRERLEPIQAHNQQLIEEGRLLEEKLALLPPSRGGAPVPGGLPPARERTPSHLPSRWARRQWLAFGSMAAFLLLGSGLLHVLRPPRTTDAPRITLTPPVANQPPKTLPARAAPVAEPENPAPGELLLKTRGLSWMEVRTLNDTTLFMGNLQGARSFPLDRGLRISAGRPDLVMVQRHAEPAKTLGGIREIGWHTFAPMPPAGGRGPDPMPRQTRSKP
jgi:hypothetical protein